MDILALIDNAIADTMTSDDAMRWTPEGRTEDGWTFLGYTETPPEWTYNTDPLTDADDVVRYTVTMSIGMLYYRVD